MIVPKILHFGVKKLIGSHFTTISTVAMDSRQFSIFLYLQNWISVTMHEKKQLLIVYIRMKQMLPIYHLIVGRCCTVQLMRKTNSIVNHFARVDVVIVTFS
jgi:hypothetical protein